jgi:hypothetical protein
MGSFANCSICFALELSCALCRFSQEVGGAVIRKPPQPSRRLCSQLSARSPLHCQALIAPRHPNLESSRNNSTQSLLFSSSLLQWYCQKSEAHSVLRLQMPSPLQCGSSMQRTSSRGPSILAGWAPSLQPSLSCGCPSSRCVFFSMPKF